MATKAYSYLRFSTPEQAKGDSSRRQTALARDYAVRHDLDLDEALTFADLGVSAFRGRNAETGRLGEFLTAVRDGVVAQGSYLLVESLDRISRQAARKALRALENIVEAGITVVTLSDGKAYTAESIDDDPMSLMLALMIFIRSNEESATKSRRLKAAWENKRATADKRPITARGPAWLELTADRQWRVREDRAEVVRHIYGLANLGIGEHSIAATLNRDGVPPFGNGSRKATHWHRTSVIKILTNPAVGGTLVPYTQEHVDGRKVRTQQEPIEGYFPAIISPEVRDSIQALKAGSANPQRGRHASREMRNIVGGLARCPMCNNTMTRVTKGSKAKAGKPFLVCTLAKGGGDCRYRAVSLQAVEIGIRENAGWLAEAGPPWSDLEKIESELSNVRQIIREEEQRRDNFVEAIGAGQNSRAVRLGLARVERWLEELAEKEEALVSRIAIAKNASSLNRRAELRMAAQAQPFDIGRMNTAMRHLFSSVRVLYGSGHLEFAWSSGGRSIIKFSEPEDFAKVPEQWAERALGWSYPPIIRGAALPPELRAELEAHPAVIRRTAERRTTLTGVNFEEGPLPASVFGISLNDKDADRH